MKQSPLARHAGSLTLAAGCLFAATQLVMLWWMGMFDPSDPNWKQALLSDPIYLAGGVMYFAAFCVLPIAVFAVSVRQARGERVVGYRRRRSAGRHPESGRQLLVRAGDPERRLNVRAI